MKKIICLLSLLVCLTGCIDRPTQKSKTLEEQMKEEKKTQAQEKKIVLESGTLMIKSELKDTRTYKEMIDNVPPKNNIVNTVLLNGDRRETAARITFYPNVEIQKTIKYDLSSIDFILTLKIMTEKTIIFPATLSAQIKRKDETILNFNCQISYEPFPFSEYQTILHTIVCKANITIDDINKLRAIKDIASFVLISDGRDFSFPVPKEFFEFLQEI